MLRFAAADVARVVMRIANKQRLDLGWIHMIFDRIRRKLARLDAWKILLSNLPAHRISPNSFCITVFRKVKASAVFCDPGIHMISPISFASYESLILAKVGLRR